MLRLAHALAPFRQRPGASLIIVLTLAIGLCATTIAYSMVDALLLRPLPYADAGRLVAVFETAPDNDRRGAAPANFLDWRREARTLDGLAASLTSRRTIEGSESAERVLAGSVSGNFFTTLGARAAVGRTFLPAEDGEVGVRRVVLGDQVWRRRFGSDPRVIGQTVRIDEVPFEIVGVMPRDFLAPTPAEFWTLGDQGVPTLTGFRGDLTAARDLHYFNVIARLREGVSMDAARADMSRIAEELASSHPTTNRDLGVNILPLRDAVVGDRRSATLLLLGVVGVVLLIAGANAANLMLAASAARGREFAIRAALGASQRRLAGQLLMEGCGVALAAGAVAMIGAFVAIRSLERAGIIQLPAATPATIDLRVFLFTTAISLLVGIGASLVPALNSGKGSVGGNLRTRGASGSSHRGLRRGLAAFQLGLSLTLLNGAGLLLLGYATVSRSNPGFDANGVSTVSAALSSASYGDPARMAQYYDRAIAAVVADPEVSNVAAISNVPGGGASMDRGFLIEGRPAPERGTDQTIEYGVVTPGYFTTMRIPVVSGRALGEGDVAAAPLVAVISESARRRYWPDSDPIGARIGFGRPDGSRAWPTIVGVVGDVRHAGLDQPALPAAYVPMAQDPVRAMTIVVRTHSGGTVGAAASAAVRAIDPSQPVTAVQRLSDQLSATIARPRNLATLLATLATVALILAAVGLYGVLSQLAVERTGEIGVRLALGATSGRIVAMIIGDATRVIGAGVLLGVTAAVGLATVLRGYLYGAASTHPGVLAAVVVVLTMVALVAAWLPARRAARLEPARVLVRG